MFGQLIRQLRNEEKYQWARLRQSTIGRLDAGMFLLLLWVLYLVQL